VRISANVTGDFGERDRWFRPIVTARFGIVTAAGSVDVARG